MISRELNRPGLTKVRSIESITYNLLPQSAITTMNTRMNIYAHFFARERVVESWLASLDQNAARDLLVQHSGHNFSCDCHTS